MLHAVRLVILFCDRVELDFAWPPAGPADPVQLHQFAGVDHQHPVRPFASCPLVAQNPLGLVPVEEVASGTALFFILIYLPDETQLCHNLFGFNV